MVSILAHLLRARGGKVDSRRLARLERIARALPVRRVVPRVAR